MLCLVCVLCAIGLVFTKRYWMKRNHKKWLCKLVILLCGFVLLISSMFLPTMIFLVRSNDTGALQKEIDTLTEVNKQMESWIEIVENQLSDNPQLLNQVKEYFNKEISSNREEIERCIFFQEVRVPQSRWLLYFKYY